MRLVAQIPRAPAALIAAIFILVWCDPADAKKWARNATHKVRISYVPPKNPEHQAVYERLKKQRALERIKVVLEPIRLPKTLHLKLEGCDGISNAWYEDATITVCYEYIAELVQHAPTATTEMGLTPQAAVVGPVIEVFLHEIGHAIFDLLKVPLFGREEDAADQFAAYILLQMRKEEAQMTIRGVAHMYAREAFTQSPGFKQFADAHGLPAQRFVNLLCLAYGASPNDKELKDLVQTGLLPESRAEGCEEEYRQVDFAFRTLIHPHMDVTLAKHLARRKWLR
jgi:hypothetical protein